MINPSYFEVLAMLGTVAAILVIFFGSILAFVYFLDKIFK